MNVIFTCGGTGGHINPAIAVADCWREKYPDSNILFIGATGHMEEQLVPQAGYAIETFPVSGMCRKLSPAGLKKNLRAAANVAGAVSRCRKLIRAFQPDVIVGTGGYASFPALLAGRLSGVPVCVHEANAVPGLTTKMAAAWADKVLVCFPESVRYYKDASRVEVVGMPVRREFIYTEKNWARRELKLDSRPVVVSAFGSQGAKVMNETMAELFKLEKNAGFPYQHIHAVGSFGWEWMPELVKQKGIDLQRDQSIMMQEYLYNMPTVMAAADVIISRAGASTCNEIAASGTPCVLIPSPNVTDNHQEKNARALEKPGGAVVVLEKECSAQRIFEEIQKIVENPQVSEKMQKALHAMVVPDSAERVCAVMEAIMKRG